jgi:TatD DNase family protein
MTGLFDTHAHFEGTAEETAPAMERARKAGVAHVMAVGGSKTLNEGTTGFKYRAVGWDRDQVGQELPSLDYSNACAVGEIGLDYYYSAETKAAQRELFSRQLEKSLELDLPVVVHTRDADDDTLAILREIPARGIIHCFTGSPEFCRALLDLGFYISISGIVTFKAADNVREAALYVPDDRLLVETDSPFLAPVPMRGKENEPAFITHTVKFISELRKTSPEILSALTFANAEVLLNGLNDKHYA